MIFMTNVPTQCTCCDVKLCFVNASSSCSTYLLTIRLHECNLPLDSYENVGPISQAMRVPR